MKNKDEVIVYDKNEVKTTGNGMYLDMEKFEHGQRVAMMLSKSTMVPDHFKNNVGNCLIALNLASRVGLDPFMLMQRMYIIKGKPGIEAQLAIALINKSGKFSPLRFKFSGEGKTRACTAYAKDIVSGETCEQTVTWGMVEKEGWNKKAGSKWMTMPDLMFQYRSAIFFGRLFCPEALLGMQTRDELTDVNPTPTPSANSLLGTEPETETEAEIVDEEEIDYDHELAGMMAQSKTAYEMVKKEVGVPMNDDDMEKFKIRFDEVVDG